MNKLLFLIVIVVVVWLSSSVGVFADGDNLQAAGEEALQKWEEILLQKKTELGNFVQGAAEDRIVTKDEMWTLKGLVDDFNKTKSRFDRELDLYGLETSVSLDGGCQAAVNAYFMFDIILMKDDSEVARRFFVAQTGHDIRVEVGAVFVTEASIIFLVLCGIALVILFVGLAKGKDGVATAGGVIIVILVILSMLFIAN